MATDQYVDPFFPADGQQVAPVVEGKPIVDPFFGPQAAPQQSEGLARDLPEITTAPRLNTFIGEDANAIGALLATGGFLSTIDQDERAKILVKQFPGAFEILEDAEGNLVAKSDKGEFALNRPGISPSDITSFVARTVLNFPAGRSVSTATTLGKQLASRSAQVAGKSGALEGLLQFFESSVGGDFDTSEIALATATGGIAEGVTGIPQARAALSEAPEIVEQASQVTSKTGIRLSRAQSTVDPFLLEEQSFVSQLPEGARPAIKFLRTQNEETADAVRSFVGDYGTPNSVIVGPNKIKTLANKSIELAKGARAEKSSPLYESAFRTFDEAGDSLDVSSVIDSIDRRIAKYPTRHPAVKALKVYRDDVLENSSSLRRLQGVKENADTELAALAPRGTSAYNKATRELAEVQTELLNKMDIASPEFADARVTFAKESIPVDALRESIVGKLADVDPTRLKSVSRIIFDPAETNEQVIRSAKKAITAMEGGQEAWDDIIRVELERRLGSVRADMADGLIAGETLENLPGQFRRALFPNKKAKDVLYAGLNKDQREAAQFLDEALRKASLGRNKGSQTAARQEIRERFGKGFVAAIRRFIREPLSTFAEIGEESKRSRDIAAVAEIIFDPDWAKEVNRVRRLAGNQEEKFYDLLSQVSNSLAQSTRAQRSNANSEDASGNRQ